MGRVSLVKRPRVARNYVVLYALAAAAVFLVLAALYESWSIPLAVILVIPLGLIGAALGVTGRNMFEALLGSIPAYANDIYFQVGFVTVMGLSAKNAILIIEFAKTCKRKARARLKPRLPLHTCVSVRLS